MSIGRIALGTTVEQVCHSHWVDIWLPKDASVSNLVKGEVDVDPGTHGNVV